MIKQHTVCRECSADSWPLASQTQASCGAQICFLVRLLSAWPLALLLLPYNFSICETPLTEDENFNLLFNFMVISG